VVPYILRRLLILPVIMLLVTFVLFFLLLQMPLEQRAEIYMPELRPNTTEAQRARIVQGIIERYGLDEPIPVQYVTWLRGLVAGEWGFSPSWNQPVLEGLVQRTPASIELALAAMIPSIVLALSLGSLASRHYGRLPDHVVRAAAFVGWAFPSFILGLMLMNVLYAWLRWFPPERLDVWAQALVEGETFRTYTGLYTVDALLNGNLGIFWNAARHLVLPGFTLAVTQWALLTRITRSSLLDVLRQDYITTARAKGVPEPRVINLHARRNAVLPVISTSGVAVSLLISGVVVIEAIFSFDGIGRAAVEAILAADTPAIVGFTLFTCVVTVLTSLIADVLYAFVDPRARLYQQSNHQ
jgi:peptide/nickel transport system permease protein